jgi:hypothetical protein
MSRRKRREGSIIIPIVVHSQGGRTDPVRCVLRLAKRQHLDRRRCAILAKYGAVAFAGQLHDHLGLSAHRPSLGRTPTVGLPTASADSPPEEVDQGVEPPPRAATMSWFEAHCPRSCLEMAAAISSGNRSGVQAKTGISSAAMWRALS